MSALPPVRSSPSKKKGKKSKRTATPALPLAITDHSLETRYRRGELVVERNAADPDNPKATITRARYMPVYDRLHSKRSISDGQREAADRYAVQHERMGGAKWVNGEMVGGGTPHWQRLPASEIQLDAATDIRLLHAALGTRMVLLARLLIIEDRLVTAMAGRLGVLPGPMMGEISGMLTRMLEHWNLDEDGSPKRRRSTIR